MLYFTVSINLCSLQLFILHLIQSQHIRIISQTVISHLHALVHVNVLETDIKWCYYMARAWVGKINQILPEQARLSYLVCKTNFPESHIINFLLTKLVQLRWLDVGLILFWRVLDLDPISVHKHAKKGLDQYPAILTSHFVNNQYIFVGGLGLMKNFLSRKVVIVSLS